MLYIIYSYNTRVSNFWLMVNTLGCIHFPGVVFFIFKRKKKFKFTNFLFIFFFFWERVKGDEGMRTRARFSAQGTKGRGIFEISMTCPALNITIIRLKRGRRSRVTRTCVLLWLHTENGDAESMDFPGKRVRSDRFWRGGCGATAWGACACGVGAAHTHTHTHQWFHCFRLFFDV